MKFSKGTMISNADLFAFVKDNISDYDNDPSIVKYHHAFFCNAGTSSNAMIMNKNTTKGTRSVTELNEQIQYVHDFLTPNITALNLGYIDQETKESWVASLKYQDDDLWLVTNFTRS